MAWWRILTIYNSFPYHWYQGLLYQHNENFHLRFTHPQLFELKFAPFFKIIITIFKWIFDDVKQFLTKNSQVPAKNLRTPYFVCAKKALEITTVMSLELKFWVESSALLFNPVKFLIHTYKFFRDLTEIYRKFIRILQKSVRIYHYLVCFGHKKF